MIHGNYTGSTRLQVANDTSSEVADEDHEKADSLRIPWVPPPLLYELYAQPPVRRSAEARRYLKQGRETVHRLQACRGRNLPCNR
jgi:hypothetical protein